MLNDSAVSAQVVLTREKHRHRADITLHARGEKFLHGVGEPADWETSLTRRVDKIAQQAQKVKGKWQERKRRGRSRPRRAAAEAPVAARGRRRREPAASAPRMPRDPARVAAGRQADVGGRRGARRSTPAATASSSSAMPRRPSISVLYRRANGELTLVETEA